MIEELSNGQHLTIDLTHLVIISCLPDNEDNTDILAIQLNEIRANSSRADQSEVLRIVVSDPDELVLELELLVKQFESFKIRNGLTLLVQGHGYEISTELDKNGLLIGKDDKFISWMCLQPIFSRLNRATAGNLGLCISTCFGYSVISSLVSSIQHDCAPFRYFVGSFEEEYDADFELFWVEFFSTLFKDDDLTPVFNAHPSIHLESIEKATLEHILAISVPPVKIDESDSSLRGLQQFLDLTNDYDFRLATDRQWVRRYLLLNEFPELAGSLDLSKIATHLKDPNLKQTATFGS